MGNYDHHRLLVIDPALDFLTYMGGKKTDLGWAITLRRGREHLHRGRNAFERLGRLTNAIVFPTIFATNRASLHQFSGGETHRLVMLVASYDPNGVLRFLTYLGGKRDDGALAIAADSTDGVWVTGFTDSTDFPIINAWSTRTNLSGPNNAWKATLFRRMRVYRAFGLKRNRPGIIDLPRRLGPG